MSDDLGGVVEQDSVRAIGQLVAEPVLGGEVDELRD